MGNTGGAPIEVLGLVALVKVLKGPEFRDVNNALRGEAMLISEQLVPHVEHAVSLSKAPQARAMRGTVKPKRDRVPVLSIGATNPKFRSKSGRKPPFTRRGKGPVYHRRRRGAIAHGVVYGTAGGRRPSDGGPGGGDYYKIARDESGGPVGRYMNIGPGFRKAAVAYFEAYQRVLKDAGIKLRKGRMAA